MTYQLEKSERQLDILDFQIQEQLEQQKALLGIIKKIREPLDLETIFKTTATEVRQLLKADRVAVFKFDIDHDWEGEFVSEDVASGWDSVMNQKVHDHCFGEQFAVHYQQGRVQAVADIYAAGLSDCHAQILAQFQVRANLVVPLLQENLLWGLLCVHQCGDTRDWKESEIEFIRAIAEHFTVAIQQTEYFRKLELQAAKLAQAAQRDRVIAQIVDKIRTPLDIETIFTTTTQDIRELIQADRVAIFRFNSDWSGDFVAESFAEGWTPLVGIQPIINDTYLKKTQGGRYVSGETFTANDIYQAGLTDCHVALVEQFEAKAFATAPILQGDILWGVIAAYQNSAPRIWEQYEVDMLTQIGTQIGVVLKHQELLSKARNQTEQQKTLTGVITRIRESLDLEKIFKTTVTEVRQLLGVDRVGVFRFDKENDWEGEFIYEDVGSDWDSAIAKQVHDHCFSENFAPLYQQGKVNAIADIYQDNFKDCYIELFEKFQVRAHVVAPLLKEGELWGLICIHQCDKPRNWQTYEIEFISQIAEQLSVALKQDLYVKQVQTQAVQLAEATEREKAIERQKLLAATVDKIRQSLDIKAIFKTTTQAVRELLEVERVAIYKFNSDWRGKFVADSFKNDWKPIINTEPIVQPKFSDDDDDNFPRNETFVPISEGEKLWGLLVAYQNSQPRYWKEEEVNLLAQVGIQLGIAIQQAELLEKTKIQAAELADALQELKQTQAQLIQGEKMAGLGQLMAGVAHEINNPVNFIFANLTYVDEYSQSLLDLVHIYQRNNANVIPEIEDKIEEIDLDYIVQDFPKTLESMKIGAQRIRQIVLSLRNFSRKDEAEIKGVDIHEGLDSTLLILGHRLKTNPEYSRIEVIKNYGKLPLVQCYPAQLNQVFMNILSNSIDALEAKFAASSPTSEKINLNIQISTEAINDKVIIKIADNGCGIPEQVRNKIFDPFFTTKDVGKGTGLGLPICYQIIVEKHQGKIQCSSQVEQGTEFQIELPIKHIKW